MTGSSPDPAPVRSLRLRVQALVGIATPGGAPDSNLHRGKLARLLHSQGFGSRLPEDLGDLEGPAAPEEPAQTEWCPSVRKGSRAMKSTRRPPAVE